MPRLYLYLASRNKKGIKLITVLPASETHMVSSAITDLSTLNLPIQYQKKIERIISDNRMTHELRAETCSSYEILRQRLKARGFTNITMGAGAMLQMPAYSQGPVATTKNLGAKGVMIQKGHPKRKFA